MSIDAVIRRQDDEPLGTLDDVKQKLEAVFQGIKFHVENEPPKATLEDRIAAAEKIKVFGDSEGGVRKLRAALHAALLSPNETEYPFTIAQFHGGTFAADFQFGSDPTIRELPVTLYGMGSVDAEPYLKKLLEANGWELEWR